MLQQLSNNTLEVLTIAGSLVQRFGTWEVDVDPCLAHLMQHWADENIGTKQPLLINVVGGRVCGEVEPQGSSHRGTRGGGLHEGGADVWQQLVSEAQCFTACLCY